MTTCINLGRKNPPEKNLSDFLFDEIEADLLTNAHDIIPPLLEQYRAGLKT